MFIYENMSKQDIVKAGEETIIAMYNGLQNEGLDNLRFRKFTTKVMTSTTFVQVHTLPPTSASASYHSMRVCLQVQDWIRDSNSMNPLERVGRNLEYCFYL